MSKRLIAIHEAAEAFGVPAQTLRRRERQGSDFCGTRARQVGIVAMTLFASSHECCVVRLVQRAG